MENENRSRGWYWRNYFPHYDGVEVTQMVTFHQADSLPIKLVERLESELELLEKDMRESERRKRLEDFLDIGFGTPLFKNPLIAKVIQGALLHFNEKRYRLHAWVVMPNHVHTLFTPMNSYTIDKILHSWKSYTSHETNKILQRNGKIWFPESFDRFIRNEEHFERVRSYIEYNPVKAKLCANPADWPWSSASYLMK